MTLLTKYNRINITVSILIFLAGCFAFYFVLDYVLVRQLDEALETERQEIEQLAAKYNRIPEVVSTYDQQVIFSEVAQHVLHSQYVSLKAWNSMEKETEWMRKLVFGLSINGTKYNVAVFKSQEQKESFLELILLIAAAMIALILLAGYVINRIVLKKLWQPFYNTIAQISKYDLKKKVLLQLPATKVDEFSLLNSSLNDMAKKVSSDYQTLKEFTGNAAHEMQTPLAIITANTESLIQDEFVLQNHHKSIATIDHSAKRLSRLNQSLLLLAKIENRQFELNELVDWKELVLNKINSLEDLAAAGHLKIETNLQTVTTIFHQHLADIIISNLLNNAVRYNAVGGLISIKLSGDKLSVSNSSVIPELDKTKVFDRFYRHPETKADGSGLGLSLVNQICSEAGYVAGYQFINNLHTFSINFCIR